MNLLRAQSLSLTLSGMDVLHDVSLDLAPGEIVALIGPNGCGKTSLLRAVLGHVPVRGDVSWEDKPLRKWSPRELARCVAYMPQNPTWDPNDRVNEVLRLGRWARQPMLGLETTTDDDIIASLAAQLDLTTLLDRRMDALSGGQRQRVFLGRCLAQQPRALVLDEPATFLDLRHQVELYELLTRLKTESHLAVLMACHDLNLAAMHADRAIVLKHGKTLASGAVNDVMTEPIMSEAFDLPMKRIEIAGRVQLLAVG